MIQKANPVRLNIPKPNNKTAKQLRIEARNRRIALRNMAQK